MVRPVVVVLTWSASVNWSGWANGYRTFGVDPGVGWSEVEVAVMLDETSTAAHERPRQARLTDPGS